jgi:hypothetical protein
MMRRKTNQKKKGNHPKNKNQKNDDLNCLQKIKMNTYLKIVNFEKHWANPLALLKYILPILDIMLKGKSHFSIPRPISDPRKKNFPYCLI